MTAKQLNSRDSAPFQGSASPNRSIPSPTRASLGFASPTRPLPSPYNTPKPGGRGSNIGVGMPSTTPSKGRPSLITPRARIPSAIAMPPPASPASSRSVSLNDGPIKSLGSETTRTADRGRTLSDLEVNGKALQDKIALLMSGKDTPSSAKVSSRPPSATSVRSASHVAEIQTQVDRLQSRVDSLQYENQRLREAADDTTADDLQAASSRIEALQAEREETMTRISELETQVKTTERSHNERNSKVESLERSVQQAVADLDRQRNESESRLKDLQAKLEDGDAMVKNLKSAIEAKEGLENQNDSLLKAKNAEIALLESRLQKASADWEQDRRELGGQVDELRQAGQVR
jgi:CAP-Gly domain-containing linker protein 1